MPQDEAVAARLVHEGLSNPIHSYQRCAAVLLRACFVPFLRRPRTLSLCPICLLLFVYSNRWWSLAIQRRNFARNALYTRHVSQIWRIRTTFRCTAFEAGDILRILLTGPVGFARFAIALFGASMPMGSPSMSRTSRPDAIAA